MKTRLAAAPLLGAIAAQAYSLDAATTIVNADEWAVVRNGTMILDDSFDRNITLNGGPGTSLFSGTNFSDGTPANYFVQGSVRETTANNGQAQWNTANGILVAQPPPNIPLIQLVNASITTGTDPAGPHTLTPTNIFSAVGLFDLAVPSVILGTYQFYLGNNQGAANPGSEVRIRIREMNTGPVLQFMWVNLATGQSTIIDQVSLTPAELAKPQLELEFSHDVANSDVIMASYAVGSGNTLASFNGIFTPLGSTDSSTDIFTSKIFVVPGFEAFDPVPEPSSLAILVASLLGLGIFQRKGCIRRRRYPKRRPNRLISSASVFSITLLAAVGGIIATPTAAATCASLSALALPDTTITAAQSIPAGTYTAPDGGVYNNLPAFCRIAATLTPTSDSNIKVEVWMPYTGWNGRFLGTGNGNIGGVILWRTLAFFLPLGYAVANTDMGTSPAATDPLGARALTGHPEKQIDYATRSTNLMTVRSKQIIKAFYGEHPRYSYFFGCSIGGGQGVHEALQFPGDYDGIVAGAPQMNGTHNGAGHIWDYTTFYRSPVNFTPAQATSVTAAIVKRCVGKDGGASSDNFLTDPRDCHWDPAALQCTGAATDAATCLTMPQITALRKFYQGVINPRTGERIYAGRARGSETNNGYPAGIAVLPTTSGFGAYWVFGNNFDWLTFDFDHDMHTWDGELAARNNANTADLEEFRSHGGKLILTHGFADPIVPTLTPVAYYERLIKGQTGDDRHDERERKEGLRRTQQFARLFLLPGAGHCVSGPGPYTVEGDPFPPSGNHPAPPIAQLALGPLVQWVEHGIAPDQIIAYHVTHGVTDSARPICPYPALPRYRGVGDTTKASSFACVADEDRDDNQPPAPKYLDDGDNYPIVPIDGGDYGHDHDSR